MGVAPGIAAPSRAGLGELALWVIEVERERLILWLPVLLGAGIAGYFWLAFEPSPLVLLALPVLAGLAAALARRPVARLGGIALLALGCGFGVAVLHGRSAEPWPELPRTAVVVSGSVVAVDRLEDGRRIRIEGASWEGSAPIARDLRIRLAKGDDAAVVPGDRVRLRALLRPVLPPSVPGGWDLPRAAWFSGLGGSGWALGRVEVETGNQAGSATMARLRVAVETRAAELLPGSEGAIAAALITGSQSAIGEAELQAMRDSGLAHLLSVSGLHIAVAFGMVFVLSRKAMALVAAFAAPGFVAKRPAAVLGFAAVLFYGALTGWQVPVLRSVAMCGLVALAILLDRRGITLRALALAAMLVLLVDPASLVGPSFQMSFAAVLALIAAWQAMHPVMPGLNQRMGRLGFLLPVLGMAATSVVAGLATAPFALFHFGRVALWSVPANALAVPLTSFVSMPAAALALAAMPFGLDEPAWVVLGWSVQGLLWLADAFASMPGAAPAVPLLPRWGLGACVAGLLVLCLCAGRWRLLGVLPAVIGLVSGVWATPPQVLLAADARQLAVVTAEGMVLRGADGFVAEQWLRLVGERRAIPWPKGPGEAGGVTCSAAGCSGFDGAVFVPLRFPVDPASCRAARLVVAQEPVRRACPGAVVVDRFTVWRDGAVAAWIGPAGVEVLTDRAWRGERPWVAPAPVPRGKAEAEALPLAPSE